jgi:hypothetical protein
MPWLLRRPDTFYIGTLKGVGRVYQQTVIDTYAKVAFAKLYDRKTPITAAESTGDNPPIRGSLAASWESVMCLRARYEGQVGGSASTYS